MTTATTPSQGREAVRRTASRARVGPVILGGILVAGSAFLLREAFLAADGEVAVGGPRLAPIVVSGGWLAISAAYLVSGLASLRSGRPTADDPPADEPRRPRWTTPTALVAALVAYVLVLDPLGFVTATFVFVPVATRILGSRRILRDIAVAAPLAVAVYLAFTRGLEIHLPGGVLPL